MSGTPGTSHSGVGGFYRQLVDSGHVRLTSMQPASEQELPDVADLLEQQEQFARTHLPGNAPAVDRLLLMDAAELFYHAAQLAVFPHLTEADLKLRLTRRKLDAPSSSSAVYSVDIVFQHLPRLLKVARQPERPDSRLVAALEGWARQWPLSSVGIDIGAVSARSLKLVLQDPCLSRMYVDRILAVGAISRVEHSDVAAQVRQAIGGHPDLSPQIAEIVGADFSTDAASDDQHVRNTQTRN